MDRSMNRQASFRRLLPGLLPALPWLLIALLLSACSHNRDDLEEWMAQARAQRGAALEPLPVLRTFEPYEYDAFHLRDPFTIWDDEDARTSSAAGPRPDPSRRKEPLEAFPRDALAMVGTIGMVGDMYGVIKAPDGIVYRVRPDNYLGQSEGRIVGIYEDRIELVELIPNGVGGWIEQPARIPLESQ